MTYSSAPCSARHLLALTLVFFSAGALAQGPSAAQAESGTTALPAKLVYQSPLANYRRYDEQSVQSWRGANDRVGEIGGWRAYAKEAQGVESSSETRPNDAHSGHHGGAAK